LEGGRPFMGQDLDQVKYEQGLARILHIALMIWGYDWEWFMSQVKTRKSPIANVEDEKALLAIAESLKNLKPTCEYLDKRGTAIQKDAGKANLN